VVRSIFALAMRRGQEASQLCQELRRHPPGRYENCTSQSRQLDLYLRLTSVRSEVQVFPGPLTPLAHRTDGVLLTCPLPTSEPGPCRWER